jgi:hypothetical protein
MNRDYISIKINQRALVLYAMHGVSREEARKIAAREVAAEERQQRKHVANNNHTGSALFRKLSGVLERMFATNPVQEPPRNAPIQGELALPVPNIVNRSVSDPPNKPNNSDAPCGVWDGARSDGASATWIEDEEYSPRWRDLTTDNWRASIALNEKVQREREQAWSIRLNELRGRS